MSDLQIPFDGWYDTEHMNAKGKEIYSKKVAALMKNIIKA
jgi:hypothetical protein